MPFKKVGGEHTVLITGTTLSQTQFKLVSDMIKAAGKDHLTRAELREFHMKLRKKKSSPYFISKNRSAKTKDRGIYNLGVFKLSAEAAKEGKEPVAKKKAAPKPKAAKVPKVKKEKKAPAKGKTTPVEAPAAAEAPAMA